MIQTAEHTTWYQSSFEVFERSLNGDSKSNLHDLRKHAMERFRELGFPTTKHEEWRFTNVAPMAKVNFMPVPEYDRSGVTKSDVERLSFGTTNVLVFINGHFSKEFSNVGALPSGVVMGSLSTALQMNGGVVNRHLGSYAAYTDDAFVALNTAFIQDGAYISIPDATTVDEPVHLLFISTGTEPSLLSPRNLILAGKNSRGSIVESYVSLSEGLHLTNVVTEIVAGEGSVLEHDKLQNENSNAYHVAATHVAQAARSTLTSNSIVLGGAIVRNNLRSSLDAEGSECTLNGLSLATGMQLIDNHTSIDHAKPRCSSHELYKAILDGKSRGVFNGKIFVRKDAQKTDAKQTNKTLLLSDDATIDTKPQLEIFADDVKCTHGATVGQLDEDQVFYLRSRGLDEMAARDILTLAFASEVVNRVHVKALREKLEALVREKLSLGRLN